MGLLSILYPVLCVAMVVWGIGLAKRSSAKSLFEKWLIGGLPLMCFMVIARIINEALLAPTQIWDTVHLLPAYLMADGQRIYYPMARGPILDMMYGPMTAVAYWPVTWVTREPAVAAALAKFLTVFYFFLPAYLLAFWGRPLNRRQKLGVSYALLAYTFFVFRSPALSGSAFWNHADSPALGWAGLACVLIYLRKYQSHWGWMALAALFSALSMWTKQVTGPLFVGLFCYLWISDGAKTAGRYLGWFFVAAAITTGIFSAWHGFSELWFNLVFNPSTQPWQSDLVKAEGWAVVELIDRLRWPSIVIAFFVSYEYKQNHFGGSLRVWFARHRWSMFVMLALFMVPSALMGRMRIGGDLNALSFSSYFLVTGVLTLALQYISSPSQTPEFEFTNSFLLKLLLAYSVSGMIMQLPTMSYYYLCLPKYLHRLQENPASMAYQFARRHPGEVYMPWNCLETYLGEGKIYHFEYAIFDREMGGLVPTDDHLHEDLPKRMRYIAYPFNEHARHVMKHFPEYAFQTTLPDLPKWTVYATKEAGVGVPIAEASIPPNPERPRTMPKGRLL